MKTIYLENTQTMTIRMMMMKKKSTQMASLCHHRNKSETSSMQFLHTGSKNNKSKLQKAKKRAASLKTKVQKALIAFQNGNVLILSAKKTILSALFA